MLSASAKTAAPATTARSALYRIKRQRPRSAMMFTLMKPRPPLRAVLILTAAPIVILILLSLLASSLATEPIRRFDLWLPAYLHTFASVPLTRVLLAFTWLGAIRTVVPAVALAIVWLMMRQCRRAAVLLGVAITGALILNELLKLVFHRARPALVWSLDGLAAPPEHTFSFPSGHALFATVLYGMLAWLALQQCRSGPKVTGFVTLAVFMPLAIGLSRVYFGMHHPTDVLAGYIAGMVWVAAVLMADRTRFIAVRRAPSPQARAGNDRFGHP